jgi:hypothetical protein
MNNFFKSATATWPIGRKLADFSCFAKIGHYNMADLDSNGRKLADFRKTALPIADLIAEKF